MSDEAPVLLLGFNRPEKMRQIISALRTSSPRTVLIAVDGPRASHDGDASLVQLVQQTAELIDWTDNVHTLFRESNLGLRTAVTQAVTWAVSRHGRVIVLEDDCIPGPSCVPFMQWGLDQYAHEQSVAHINGYNLVPRNILSRPDEPVRKTRYIESYAWATWERAWTEYDDSLEWALESSLSELANIVGSRTAAIRWKINFRDAAAGRINTWAYRWMATIWSNRWSVVAPNVNLCRYDGHEGGTHTLRKARWKELPVDPSPLENPLASAIPTNDVSADSWTGQTVFRENWPGLLEGVLASSAMELRRRLHA